MSEIKSSLVVNQNSKKEIFAVMNQSNEIEYEQVNNK